METWPPAAELTEPQREFLLYTFKTAMPETILYVEDDPNDQVLVQRALKKLASPVVVITANDGDEAIAFLEGHGKYGDRQSFPLPSVIFLDIKLPKKGGFEVLEWLKEQPLLKRIPVVMISGSNLQQDIDRAYHLGASAYLVKPVEVEELQKLFRLTGEFFLEHAERPSLKRHAG
jgi:CheY-like chemotaxis protein